MTAITHTFRFTGSGEDFGPRADGIITAHTTESPYNKLTVADAIALARWQDRDDIVGSYNEIICIDGVLSCVPANHASGGINPSGPEFVPDAWLYDVLSREEVHNPNYFTRNISFMGSKAWFDANGWPPAMIDRFARLWIEEEERIGRKVVLTDHEDFQTNRSDAGPIANALIRTRYAQLTGKGADMIFRNPIVTQEWDTVPGAASTFTRPDGSTGYFSTKERVKSVAEGTVNGVDSRLLDYGPNHEALVIPRSGLTNWGPRIVGSPSPTTVVKEVIKEVPTGITQEQVQAAADAAVVEERRRLRVLLGLG